MNVIADRLRKARIKADLTLDSLSEKSGISKATLQRYETGKSEPSIDKIMHLSKILNIRFQYLFGFESEHVKETEIKIIIELLEQLGREVYYNDIDDTYYLINAAKFANSSDDIEDMLYDCDTEVLSPLELYNLQGDILDYADFKINKLISLNKLDYSNYNDTCE